MMDLFLFLTAHVPLHEAKLRIDGLSVVGLILKVMCVRLRKHVFCTNIKWLIKSNNLFLSGMPNVLLKLDC